MKQKSAPGASPRTASKSVRFGIDKLERLKLLQGDPQINEFGISGREPETVSRFLGNFSFKTTQMLREVNFKVFKKLLRKKKLKSITIDIDSVWSTWKVTRKALSNDTTLISLGTIVTTSSLHSATKSRLI